MTTTQATRYSPLYGKNVAIQNKKESFFSIKSIALAVAVAAGMYVHFNKAPVEAVKAPVAQTVVVKKEVPVVTVDQAPIDKDALSAKLSQFKEKLDQFDSESNSVRERFNTYKTVHFASREMADKVIEDSVKNVELQKKLGTASDIERAEKGLAEAKQRQAERIALFIESKAKVEDHEKFIATARAEIQEKYNKLLALSK